MTTSSDASRGTQAFVGAGVGAATILGLGVLCLVAMTPRVVSNPEMMIGVIPAMLTMGLLIAIPSLLIAAAGGAMCGPLVARLAFPIILAILVSPFALLPVIQHVLWLHDTVRGVYSGGFRTVFESQPWRQFWPLAPIAFCLSLIAGIALTSRALSIPITAVSRWWQPLDQEAWSRA